MKDFYYKHLVTNLVVYYLLKNLKIKGNLKEFIINGIIKKCFYINSNNKTIVADNEVIYPKEERLETYYLALKWFYNDKTKKYYSKELLKEISEYEKAIKYYTSKEYQEKTAEYEAKYGKLKFKY